MRTPKNRGFYFCVLTRSGIGGAETQVEASTRADNTSRILTREATRARLAAPDACRKTNRPADKQYLPIDVDRVRNRLSVLNLWVESGVSGFQLMAVLLYLACDHMEIKVSTRAQNVASTMSEIAKAPNSTNENWVAGSLPSPTRLLSAQIRALVN